MTWGRMDPIRMMDKFESLALSRFEPSAERVEAGDEPRWKAPKSVSDVISGEHYDGTPAGQLYCAWLLGLSTDLDAVLIAQLAIDLLLIRALHHCEKCWINLIWAVELLLCPVSRIAIVR